MGSLILLGFLASLMLGGAIFLVRAGKKSANLKTVKETLKDVEKAKDARDNLDDTERKRLFDKYKRK